MDKIEEILVVGEEINFGGLPVFKYTICKAVVEDDKILAATKQTFYFDIRRKNEVLSGLNLDLFIAKTEPVNIFSSLNSKESILFIGSLETQGFLQTKKAPLI